MLHKHGRVHHPNDCFCDTCSPDSAASTHTQQWLHLLATCSNTAKQKALEDLSKRIAAAQSAVQQLNKQLASTHGELAAVQEMDMAMQAVEHKASELCEVLLRHDDAEHMAYSTTAGRVAQMLSQLRQHASNATTPEAASALPATGCQSLAAPESCDGSMEEDEASAALEQLCAMLMTAGICPDQGDAPGAAHASCSNKYTWLPQRMAQLRADDFSLFWECSVRDWTQQQRLAPP